MKSEMRYAAIAAMLIAAVFAGSVSAATATGTFTVSLTVNKTCVVNTTSASNITLPAVNAGAATTQTSGTFTVNCSNLTPFYVGLQPSGSSTTGAGTLKGGIGNTSTIPYQLYQGGSGTTIWGNTATTSSVGNGMSGTGAGMSSAKAVSFNVSANTTGTNSTDVQPDTYSDTVTINVNF